MISSRYLELLEIVRARYDLPAFPEPPPSSRFHLELQSGVAITIDYDEESKLIEFLSELGSYQESNELPVLQKIAQGNFFWALTAGGTLSARLDIRMVYLAYQIPIELITPEIFISFLEKFAPVAEHWFLLLKAMNITNEEKSPTMTL